MTQKDPLLLENTQEEKQEKHQLITVGIPCKFSKPEQFRHLFGKLSPHHKATSTTIVSVFSEIHPAQMKFLHLFPSWLLALEFHEKKISLVVRGKTKYYQTETGIYPKKTDATGLMTYK
ncbi:hypothetical protein PanWU01x14_033450, partial [Parasponia andersonii]